MGTRAGLVQCVVSNRYGRLMSGSIGFCEGVTLLVGVPHQ